MVVQLQPVPTQTPTGELANTGVDRPARAVERCRRTSPLASGARSLPLPRASDVPQSAAQLVEALFELTALSALAESHSTAYLSTMVRVLRVSVLVIVTFITLSLIVALARPETGPMEKAVLGTAVVALVLAARPVQRRGSRI